MELALSSKNAVDFLKEHKICPPDFEPTVPVICKEGTNFNLVVKSDGDRSFLVKQNRIDARSKTSESLPVEWIVQELINNFPSLASIQPLVSEVLLLDWSNGILVSVFYDNYLSLDLFYGDRQSFDPRISSIFGANLAKIHSATYQQQSQFEFLNRYLRLDSARKQPEFIKRLTNLDASIFGKVCPDGLSFYKLYQRFPSLNRAIIELYENIQPSCLIHNDLTLDNFIIDRHIDFDADLVQIAPEQIKIIDWERIDWGDPAVDLGMVISEYIGSIWLGNLISDRNLDINSMLSTATFPLETITPTLKAFMQEYLIQFPEITLDRRDFIRRVVQFVGIGILNRLTYYVEHHYPFNNSSVCKLQVAKNLLCYPEQGIETIFGTKEAELLNLSFSSSSTNEVDKSLKKLKSKSSVVQRKNPTARVRT